MNARGADGIRVITSGSRPLRVLHWYWQTNTGGIHRVVTDLTRAQQRDKTLEVRLLVGRGRGEGPLDSLDLRHGFDFGRYGATCRALAWADLVHMHIYNPVVASAVRRSGKPCVYTDHGTDRHKSLRNLLVVFQLQRRFVRNRATLLTVNSSFRRRTQQEFYAIRDEKIRVVRNGLDFDALRPAADNAALRRELGIGPGEQVAGTLAVFQLRKRLHLLLEAFARVEGLLYPPARLLIVGDGMMRPQLERRAQELGIADRVIFTGYREDPYDLVSLMDVFVLPTRGEPFGLAAVEALALGRPVIVFKDGGGLAEIVRDGENGFVVSDVAEAAECLRDLLQNPALRARLGRFGALDVRRRFSIGAMAESIRACYDEAASLRTP